MHTGPLGEIGDDDSGSVLMEPASELTRSWTTGSGPSVAANDPVGRGEWGELGHEVRLQYGTLIKAYFSNRDMKLLLIDRHAFLFA